MTAAKYPCPVCGQETDCYFTCHTYQEGGGWKACMPCDSATRWYCPNNTCNWPGYTQGLNPANPRAERNEQNRPAWISDATALHLPGPAGG